MAVVLGFIDGSFSIQQRLVHLQLLAKSMAGEEIVGEIIHFLSV